MLQETDVDHAGHLGDTISLIEVADGTRCITPAPQTAKGGEAGVVPAIDQALFNQGPQFSLTHDRIVDVKTREFNLPRFNGKRTVVNDPIEKGAVVFKLK